MQLKRLIGLSLVLVVVVYLSPVLDQQLAKLPYDFVTHSFYGETHLWVKVIYYSVSLVTALLIVIPLGMLYISRNWADAARLRVQRMALISLVSLALGPGLVVNSGLKEHWGRARPYQVLRDHHPFSLPWQPHFARSLDNSFPSGHVSIGAFIGIPFIAYRRQRLGISLCMMGTLVVGVVRWLQGGHYLSDILLAAVLVWLISFMVTIAVDYFWVKVELDD